MHIAFLTPEFPHQKISHSAGIGTSVYNLASELVKQKHKVTVFVYGQDTNEAFEDKGINFVKIQKKSYPFFGWYLYRKKIESVLNKHIVKHNIQLIEAPDWTGITAFMNLKCPLIIRLHGSDTYFCHLEKRKQKWKNKWFEKVALNNANAVVAVSEFVGNLTKKLFNIKAEITTIPNSINISNTVFDDNYEEENTILYFGTIIRKKGVLELPKIFELIKQQVPSAKLLLIGNDSADVVTKSNSTWKLMKQMFSPNSLNSVEYLGTVPYSELKKYIDKCSICIFPSYAESFGMVTIEAMEREKPVIVSDFGWAREIIEHNNNGFLIEHNNYEAFSNIAVKLLLDKEFSKKIGKNAREKVISEFSTNIIYSKNSSFYKSILTSK